MNFIKTLFNFSNTISGVDFAIRWVASFILQFAGGFLIGLGVMGSEPAGLTFGIIIAAIGLALQVSTLVKRSRALFGTGPNHVFFYVTYMILSIVRSFAPNLGEVFNVIVISAILSFFVFAIAKNTNPTEEHIG